MTDVLRAAREEARDAAAWVGRQLGLFLLVGSLLATVSVAISTYGGVEPTDVGLSSSALFVAGILVAGGVATWLEAGGFERLRADPSAAGEFVVLGLIGLPFSLLPTAYAVSLLLGEPSGLQAVYQLCCVLAAALLTLYGGLDRLGLDADLFTWTPIYVVAGGFVAAVGLQVGTVVQIDSATSLQSAIDWLQSEPGVAVVLLGGQLLAFSLGWLHARRGETPLAVRGRRSSE